MLDPIIHKHLDKMDELIIETDKEIDDLINDLNIDAIMNNPRETVFALFQAIQDEIVSLKMKKALELGEKFAKDIQQDGEVVIQKTNDSEINQGVVGDTSRD